LLEKEMTSASEMASKIAIVIPFAVGMIRLLEYHFERGRDFFVSVS
jgi:hypothetical protein